MQLPRWLVMSLLSISLLSAFGAGAWSWVTWPERSALEFIDEVRSLPPNLQAPISMRYRDERPNWDPQPRTWTDVVLGREVIVVKKQKYEYVELPVMLDVERGHVRDFAIRW